MVLILLFYQFPIGKIMRFCTNFMTHGIGFGASRVMKLAFLTLNSRIDGRHKNHVFRNDYYIYLIKNPIIKATKFWQKNNRCVTFIWELRITVKFSFYFINQVCLCLISTFPYTNCKLFGMPQFALQNE